MNPKRAAFITAEQTKKDFILSFAFEPTVDQSLVLLRSPPYEIFLPKDQQGVSITLVPGVGNDVRDLLVSVRWEAERVELRSQKRIYLVDVSKVDRKQISDAQRLLGKMAKDVAEITIV
jgi:hypothetical protein